MRGRPPDTTTARPIPPGPPDPRGRDLLARAVVAATWYLEVRAGRRPVAHLQDWVTPGVARQLDGLVRRRRRRRGGASSLSLVRVWAQRHGQVANVVVVLRDGHRARPVALAMEVDRPDPRIIALGLPEDHPCRTDSDDGTDSGTTAPTDQEVPASSVGLDALDALEAHGAGGHPDTTTTRIVGSPAGPRALASTTEA